MTMTGTLALLSVSGEDLRFEAIVGERSIVLDGSDHAEAANPVQHLLAAIAACEAMDVIGILRKQRQVVTAYEVLMSGERAREHPRRFVSIELVHRVTGRAVKRAAVEEAIRLSVEKYCSVHHCLRPDLPITSRIEIVEARDPGAVSAP